MKTNLIITVLVFILTSSKCVKESDHCHKKIKFINNSKQNIEFATKFTQFNKCLLAPIFTESDGYSLKLRECYENDLKNRTLDIYVVDSNFLNQDGRFYSCDSILIKNKILKEYKLTLSELQKTDFVVTYE